jgi:hypothetical protein
MIMVRLLYERSDRIPQIMSDLTFVEKQKLEKLLGMASGYVLDFSDRTFDEFVSDSTGRDIFDAKYNYRSGSKANRLRAFWHKEDNAVVGKLMHDMLDYLGESGQKVEVCRLIVARLLNVTSPSQTTPKAQEMPQAQLTIVLSELRQEFSNLTTEKDRAKAGLALEGFLHRLFVLFQLHPRQPFRVTGEQIDGSFELDGHVYLVESKWERSPLPEADLLIFGGKIEKKSTFTRGVFIALNGISDPARRAITQGKAPSFFVIDGHDLMMVLNEAISLPEFLRRRVRLLAEEGRVCAPFSELR